MSTRFFDAVTGNSPELNVIDDVNMKKRIHEVFSQLAETLQKSLGPLGAPTLISQRPYYHITKDGFTIMKNLRYNQEFGYADQIIADMISDICGRLNYAVGDGTTSAVVAANSLFQSFNVGNDDELMKQFVLPRNLIRSMNEIVDKIVTKLESNVIDIKNLPKEEMVDYIRKVVYISSNADEEMTKIITDIYAELEYPAISVKKSQDGKTVGEIIHGFSYPAKMLNQIYVNNDSGTHTGKNYDVLIFDHKVNVDEYHYIISPTEKECMRRERKLIVLAPLYDDNMLHTEIQNDVNKEYQALHDVYMILMGYPAMNDFDKKRIGDLAMLCNTSLITLNDSHNMIEEMMKRQRENQAASVPINIDDRTLTGMLVKLQKPNSRGMLYEPYDPAVDINNSSYYVKDPDAIINLGFVDTVDLKMNGDSVFDGFHYDEPLYQKYLEDAKKEVEVLEEKYKKLGTFNLDTDRARKRLLGLKQIMAEIRVGANSSFSQDFEKDAMDDAVKAAQSAYNNGVILGGHVDLMRSIWELIEENAGLDARGEYLILEKILSAFRNVRKAVLVNGIGTKERTIPTKDVVNAFLTACISTYGKDQEVDYHTIQKLFDDHYGIPVILPTISAQDAGKIIEMASNFNCSDKGTASLDTMDILNVIIAMEITLGLTLDLDIRKDKNQYKMTFNRNVINSMATDHEILLAASDLVSLLITGNQMVFSIANLNYAQ